MQPVGDDLIKATAASVYRHFDQPSKADNYAYELAAYRDKDLTPLLSTIADDEFDRLRRWLSEATQAPALAANFGQLVRKFLPILLIAAIIGALLAYLKH
ncbi:hypothetical protein IQ25_00317 [Novosphingobium taihuense]|nr:hypothetical protein IQ25_00317 [Novosphingobium taihuense]